MSAEPGGAIRRTRTLVQVAGSLALMGIVVSATGSPEYGGWLTVAALLGLLFGLHRLGRLGPDAPLSLPTPPKRGKRRKQKRRSSL